MPANVSERILASVTAGLPELVDDVKKYAPEPITAMNSSAVPANSASACRMRVEDDTGSEAIVHARLCRGTIFRARRAVVGVGLMVGSILTATVAKPSDT